METIVPQTEYSDSKHILEMLEDLIESVQMNIDCNDPNNSESYATLVHVRAFVRGEPVYDEPNPVSLPDLLKRAESSLEALACKSGEIYALQTRLAEYVQGTNDLVSRAEEAEQELERLLHSNEITGNLLGHNRRMRALDRRIAHRIEDELMQGINDLVSRVQAAETRVREMEDAFERAEDSHLAVLRKGLAQTFQERDALQRQLATLEIRVQAQRSSLATALARCDELQALADAHKSEADNLQSAFEIAHKRREQLYNDNCDLSSAVVDLAHINQQLTTRLTQVLDLFDDHDLLWEIHDEADARAASEIIKAARELVGKV